MVFYYLKGKILDKEKEEGIKMNIEKYDDNRVIVNALDLIELVRDNKRLEDMVLAQKEVLGDILKGKGRKKVYG
jgi:hypothetical protein